LSFPFAASQVSDDCPDAPENDECQTASSVSTFPFTVAGSTLFASPLDVNQTGYGGNDDAYNDNSNDDGYGYSGCPFLDPSSKSVWYLVEGDGSCMTASVTGNFDASVSVFRGNQCSDLICINLSNDYSSNRESWQTVTGESYYVVIGGRYRRAGDFFLDIKVRDVECEFG
jgi:hypothetical protein